MSSNMHPFKIQILRLFSLSQNNTQPYTRDKKLVRFKGKGKLHPRTGHEGPEGE